MNEQLNGTIGHTATVRRLQTREATCVTNEVDGRQVAAPAVPSQIKRAETTGSLPGRSTGPRSPEGKQRSRLNALKHGIFARIALAKGESRTEFSSLVTGLREDFQPEGLIEELLVEQLSMLVWRRRRVLLEERAEMERVQEATPTNRIRSYSFEERLREIRKKHDPENSSAPVGDQPGQRFNPYSIREGIRLLTELRGNIEERGFDPDKDSPLLSRVYGSSPFEKPLRGSFKIFALLVELGKRPNLLPKILFTPEMLQELEVELMNAEIQRLENLQQAIKEIKERLLDGQKKASTMPPPEATERLVRYEKHISCEFDRTLSQLERLQRMRRGQPVLPPVKVELST